MLWCADLQSNPSISYSCLAASAAGVFHAQTLFGFFVCLFWIVWWLSWVIFDPFLFFFSSLHECSTCWISAILDDLFDCSSFTESWTSLRTIVLLWLWLLISWKHNLKFTVGWKAVYVWKMKSTQKSNIQPQITIWLLSVTRGILAEQYPKLLFDMMPIIWIKPSKYWRPMLPSSPKYPDVHRIHVHLTLGSNMKNCVCCVDSFSLISLKQSACPSLHRCL